MLECWGIANFLKAKFKKIHHYINGFSLIIKIWFIERILFGNICGEKCIFFFFQFDLDMNLIELVQCGFMLVQMLVSWGVKLIFECFSSHVV